MFQAAFQHSSALVNKLRAYEIHSISLIVVVSCYLVLVTNYPFLFKTFIAITQQQSFDPIFLLSVPVLLICLFILVMSIFAISFLLKPVLICMLMVSSVVLYATHSYGVVFDYSMIQNLVETDSSEARSYLNLHGLMFVFFLGVLPSVLIGLWKIKKESLKVLVLRRFSLLLVTSFISFLIASLYYVDYAAVGRNNHELVQYINPFKLINSTFKYTEKAYFTSSPAFKRLDYAPSINESETKPSVTVLVLGETARAKSFSLNGYLRDTNALTEQQKIYSFKNIQSCGTATAVSVPCMFSRLSRDNYDRDIADNQQNVLDIASLAGVDVLWIDNNNGSCKGVCQRLNTIEIVPSRDTALCDDEYCLDEILVLELNKKLNNLSRKHTLIVLHMMGSHGPTYFRRYPEDRRVFQPDCPRSDIQNCSESELINTYDNTIAYTDYVLNEIISTLSEKAKSENIETSMMYISDHGESLGEKGAYLHGLPYAFAPDEQTHVPWLYWRGDYISFYEDSCIKSKLSSKGSHDNLYDTLLGELAVDSATYKADNDLLSSCRNHKGSLLSSTLSNGYEHDSGL